MEQLLDNPRLDCRTLAAAAFERPADRVRVTCVRLDRGYPGGKPWRAEASSPARVGAPPSSADADTHLEHAHGATEHAALVELRNDLLAKLTDRTRALTAAAADLDRRASDCRSRAHAMAAAVAAQRHALASADARARDLADPLLSAPDEDA